MLNRDCYQRSGYLYGPGGARIASCTLVAPDVVATCAHAVADALGLPCDTADAPPSPVNVCFPAAGDSHSVAHVIHWAPLDSALTPASDLALLRLDTPPPGAGLVVPVARADTLVAGRDIGTVCYDSPLSEGETRQGRITDAGAQRLTVQGEGYGSHGMSGGGVWSAGGEGVLLGLFCAVPKHETQTAGYVIPASEIVSAMAGVSITAGRGKGLFEPYPRPLPVVHGPAALLDARYAVAPFIADPTGEAALDAWIARDEPLLVRLEYGPGGVGKTRRWLEFCHARGAQGLFGVLSRTAKPDLAANHFRQVADTASMRVVVVDYAESQPDLIRHLLTEALEGRQGRTRFILLARNAADWWNDLRRADAQLQAVLSPDSPAVTEARATQIAIPEDRRGEAIAGAMAAYAKRLSRLVPAVAPDVTGRRSALEIQMMALAALTGGTMDDLIAMVLDRERRFWNGMATESLPSALLEAMAAAVYGFSGIRTLADAQTLFTGTGEFRDLPAHQLAALFERMRALYPGEFFLNPLQPDLVGERLLVEHDQK